MSCQMAKNILRREPSLAIGNGSGKARRLGYCLRENPKKSWKFLGLMENAQENPCSVCHKRFRSTTALFGHMKIHLSKDDERCDWCADRGKGSGSMKSCQDRARPIHDGERLNLSLSSEDRYVGLSKTKGDLLLRVLFDDEAMHMTRRKRTPRVSCDVNERTEGVLFSVPNGFSFSSKAEQDPANEAAVELMMMSQGEAGFNSLGLGIEHFRKSSSLDFIDMEKLRITEASQYNERHSRGYTRMEQEGVELEVPAGMLCGAWEVEHKKPEAARSDEQQMYEVAMMDRDMMRIAGSDSRAKAELRIDKLREIGFIKYGLNLGLNSYRDEVYAEESRVFVELVEENKYKSRDTNSYKREAPLNASQGIEGSPREHERTTQRR
ncbi:hypothetical protein ACJRO7_004255 [Eucalyptus globulus]|uniref:C2H2-type domain-containing protein n=1 Tax=Eucalyptus globulus TaxID=34317 RepID=A0ABD3IZ86_EUCGL